MYLTDAVRLYLFEKKQATNGMLINHRFNSRLMNN